MMTTRLRRPLANPTVITGTVRLASLSPLLRLRRRCLRLRARLRRDRGRLLRRLLVLQLLLARGGRGCWLWWWELLVLFFCEKHSLGILYVSG